MHNLHFSNTEAITDFMVFAYFFRIVLERSRWLFLKRIFTVRNYPHRG